MYVARSARLGMAREFCALLNNRPCFISQGKDNFLKHVVFLSGSNYDSDHLASLSESEQRSVFFSKRSLFFKVFLAIFVPSFSLEFYFILSNSFQTLCCFCKGVEWKLRIAVWNYSNRKLRIIHAASFAWQAIQYAVVPLRAELVQVCLRRMVSLSKSLMRHLKNLDAKLNCLPLLFQDYAISKQDVLSVASRQSKRTVRTAQKLHVPIAQHNTLPSSVSLAQEGQDATADGTSTSYGSSLSCSDILLVAQNTMDGSGKDASESSLALQHGLAMDYIFFAKDSDARARAGKTPKESSVKKLKTWF